MNRLDVGKTILNEQELNKVQQEPSKESLQKAFDAAVANAVQDALQKQAQSLMINQQPQYAMNYQQSAYAGNFQRNAAANAGYQAPQSMVQSSVEM